MNMKEFHLHRAAQDGDLKKVKHFLKEDIDSIDSTDDDNYTPLHWAAKCGQLEVVKFLIYRNGRISNYDLKAKDGSTAVLLAAESGHRSMVQLLLWNGADAEVGCSEIGGWTLLHHAARYGWVDIVKHLVEMKDTELDPETTLFMTPLLLAASEGHTDVVELLIEAGADVDFPDQHLGTVLHYAAHKGWLEIVKKVLKIESVDVNVRNEYGNTPLHVAAGMHNMDIVKELLKAGADAGIRNQGHEAALVGKTMHTAAETGDIARLEYLIRLGVSTESSINKGSTALHTAAAYNQLEVGELLIRNNCNLNSNADGGLNGEGLTPLFLATFRQHREFVDLLIKSGAKISGCQVDTNTTLLHLACCRGWTDIVQHILEKPDVNIEEKTEDGETPLLFASNGLDCTKLILQAGADVNGCNNDGLTALHAVCRDIRDVSDIELVETLLLAGADPNRENAENATAFHLAVEQRELCIEVIRLLIQHGAYFKYSDSNKLSQNNPLKELVLKDIDLCTQLIINKFNGQSLPVVYNNPEYAGKLPRMDKMKIRNTEGVGDGIAACVQKEIEENTYCNVMKMRPTVLTLMCVEALINPRPKKRSPHRAPNKFKGPVKRSARIALLKEGLSKKICSN